MCLEIGAEVSQSVLMPKCLVAEVSGNRQVGRVYGERPKVKKCVLIGLLGCSVSVVVLGRWTCDREIPGSTPGRCIAG